MGGLVDEGGQEGGVGFKNGMRREEGEEGAIARGGDGAERRSCTFSIPNSLGSISRRSPFEMTSSHLLRHVKSQMATTTTTTTATQ